MPTRLTINRSKNIDNSAFAIAEYSALRDEILKRIEIQNQIIYLTLIVAGTFLSIGYQQISDGAMILMLFPLIAVFLAASWEQNNLRIREIGIYIRERIESRVARAGWEQYRADNPTKARRSGTAAFARGAFLITQFAAVFLAISQLSSSWSPVTISLIVADFLAIITTVVVIRTLSLR